MKRVRTPLRGLAHRGRSSTAILAIAVIGCAAAGLAPTYYAAARTSIVRDSVASSSVTERGFQVRQQGQLGGTLGALSSAVDDVVATPQAGRRSLPALFQPPILGLEATTFFGDLDESVPLVFRTNVCGQVRLLSGHCPSARDQVIVSDSLARLNGWTTLQQVAATGWDRFTIVGIYQTPDALTDYWFNHAGLYFPAEYPPVIDAPPLDAIFASRDTIESAVGYHSGLASVDDVIDEAKLRPADLPTLTAVANALTSSTTLGDGSASVVTSLSATIDKARSGWHSLSVPVVLITAQTLLLVWLLLFLVVTEAIEARGRDIALAKLRGYGQRRALALALSEPVALLLLAWPLGVGLAWVVSRYFAADLLRPGTAIGVPSLGWAAAVLGIVGGLVAAGTAGWRAVRRPIVEQWRRVGYETTRRGWVFDSVVLTAAVAALALLRLGSHAATEPTKTYALVVPGLLGVTVAVISSRLLPLVCRSVFNFTGRAGPLALFLAVRHVARRPAGVRAATAMAAALALTSFGLASWVTGHANRSLVAVVANGAPAVISVDPKPGTDLGEAVNTIDPGGRSAMVVDQYLTPTGGGQVLLGVDPPRFTTIAIWRTSFADRPLADLTKALDPGASSPLVVDGDAMRLRLDVGDLSQPLVMGADLALASGRESVFVDLGTLTQHGPQTSDAAALKGCPCQLLDLTVSTTTGPGRGTATPVAAGLVITSLETRQSGAWTPLPASTADAGRWKPSVDGRAAAPASTTPDGLRWSANFLSNQIASLRFVDRPDPLPVVVGTAGAPGGTAAFSLVGMDGKPVTVVPIGAASVIPGAPAGGVLVDRTYAERAANFDLRGVQQEVWTTHAAATRVQRALQAAGFHVGGLARSADLTRVLDREGPGLASSLFLGESAAAALLAAGVAVASLAFAARRRRFEYAALGAVGESHSKLFLGLFLEQAMVLLFGALTGIATGLVAARLVASSIPEFIATPAAVPLSYTPDLRALAPVLLATVAFLVCVAAVSSVRLLAGARPETLREAAG